MYRLSTSSKLLPPDLRVARAHGVVVAVVLLAATTHVELNLHVGTNHLAGVRHMSALMMDKQMAHVLGRTLNKVLYLHIF